MAEMRRALESEYQQQELERAREMAAIQSLEAEQEQQALAEIQADPVQIAEEARASEEISTQKPQPEKEHEEEDEEEEDEHEM
ncbi:MAG: hypothetical protein WCJ64_00825 [Rhodospirillaceae bacterium]